MNTEIRPVTKDRGIPDKPEKKTVSKKAALTRAKTEDGEKNTETDRDMDDLEDRLYNLFVESEDASLSVDPGPKPAAALPDREKEKDKPKITAAAPAKNGGDTHPKPPPPPPDINKRIKTIENINKVEPQQRAHSHSRLGGTAGAADESKNQIKSPNGRRSPAATRVERVDESCCRVLQSAVNQKRLYRNRLVWGGILTVLAVAVAFIIFKMFTWVEGDEQPKTVIAHQTVHRPINLQAKTAHPSTDTMTAEKAEPVVQHDPVSSQQVPEQKEAIDLVEKEIEVLNAPAVSYPYSIHAGSYRSLQSAEQSADAYRKTGLQAFRVRVDLGEKGVWHRVFIDCYKDLAGVQGIIREKQLENVRPIRVKYANFIGAYSSDDDLKKQNRFLWEMGYSPYFIRDDNGKNYLYAGAFDTLKEAEAFSVELSSRGVRSLIVER